MAVFAFAVFFVCELKSSNAFQNLALRQIESRNLLLL